MAWLSHEVCSMLMFNESQGGPWWGWLWWYLGTSGEPPATASEILLHVSMAALVH